MKRIFLISLLLCFVHGLKAQNSKALADAQRYFSVRNYEEAIKLYEEAFRSGVKDALAFYQAGVCYQKAENISEQVKAIPYFEKALAAGDVPATIYFDLGDLYLKNEELPKAFEQFSRYKASIKNDKKALADVEDALERTSNAMAFMSVPRDFTISSFPGTVNSEYTEYNPVVSADESIMAFTALRPNTGRTRTGDKFIEEIYVSYNQSGSWSVPKALNISNDYNVGTAGISPDGQKMLIFIGGVNDPGNLFQIMKSGENWSKPSVIAPPINTKFMETTASITPDGKTIYFASDRPGSVGGLDIWRIDQKDDGSWSAPVNLGPEVNSKANEDAPFIHPDQRTLFFTSDGPRSMGGRDIFQSKLVNGQWTRAENMGYPINTTANDNYFTLLADGSRAFFSSDRKGGRGAQDIYYTDMPASAANIPLTMIKGRILDMESGRPLPTKMYVVDNETKKKLEFVYNPDPETGNYLIILPPAKNYDIIVESEGFLPYTLNINVPNQNYFYELYQMISLRTIKQFDVVVGQEVLVKNAFYDTDGDVKADLRKIHEAKLVQNGNVDVYDLMLDLISSQDKEGIEYLTELINLKDPVDGINFDEKQNSKIEVASRTYYYDESDESKFEQKNVGGATIFSLPTMSVSEEAKRRKEQKKASVFDKSALTLSAKVLFDAGKSDLKRQYHQALDKILNALTKYPDLGVEISGFASAEGSEELNRELSNKRAITVLEYLNHKGIVRRRIVAKGYGATTDANATKEEGRRVEVRVLDLNASQ